MTTSLHPPLAQTATKLLAAERPPSITPPSPEQRARSVAAIAEAIALQGRARRRRLLVSSSMMAAAAAVLVVACGFVVRRASTPAADFEHDRRCSSVVVAEGSVRLHDLGRALAERTQP
jgi:hypothetical protein